MASQMKNNCKHAAFLFIITLLLPCICLEYGHFEQEVQPGENSSFVQTVFWESKTRENWFVCFNEISKTLNNNSEWVWGCVPCRWRRGAIEGQPTLLARNLKGFQGIFGHLVGFCLHKNIVRVGGLYDGIMLHHTVDTWKKPRRSDKKKKSQ